MQQFTIDDAAVYYDASGSDAYIHDVAYSTDTPGIFSERIFDDSELKRIIPSFESEVASQGISRVHVPYWRYTASNVWHSMGYIRGSYEKQLQPPVK